MEQRNEHARRRPHRRRGTPRRPRRHGLSRQGLLVDAARPVPGRRHASSSSSARRTAATPEARFWSDIATSEALVPLRERYGDGLRGVPPREGASPSTATWAARSAASTRRSCASCGGPSTPSSTWRASSTSTRRSTRRSTRTRSARRTSSRSRGRSATRPSSTRAPATWRARARAPSSRRTRARIPFPRADELGAELWDPEREIAEGLDLIAQAKHRCEDAFRQSEFAEARARTCSRAGSRVHGEPYERELARVKRKFISERLVEAGLDRATHWGWPNIYTYTKAIGEQVIAAQRPAVHHRAPGLLRVDRRVSRSPATTRGSTPARRSSTS